MNKLVKYIFYAAIGTGIAVGTGCSSKEPERLRLKGIESRIVGIEPIYDKPRENDNRTEDYKK